LSTKIGSRFLRAFSISGGPNSFYLTLGAAGASVFVAGATKGLSALGTFFEAGGADDM